MTAKLAALLRKNIDAAAHAAATSDLNLLRKPTERQAKAGVYRKGHVRVAGMNVSLENAAGTRRKPEWPPLSAHYGYVRGTEGADGDHVDVFLRPGTPTDWAGPVYVIDQYRLDGTFDEHKCMVGWTDRRDAERAYLANYPRGWNLGPVTELSMAGFKAWLRSGDTKTPLAVGKIRLGALAKAKRTPEERLVDTLLALLEYETGDAEPPEDYGKARLALLLTKDFGPDFHGNQYVDLGIKPTQATAKGTKAAVHELLSSGHPFTFAELSKACGDPPEKALKNALSELKNPKWAGSKGPLDIVKQADGSYKVGNGKPVAAEKPAGTPKPAAEAPKPAGQGPKQAEPVQAPPAGVSFAEHKAADEQKYVAQPKLGAGKKMDKATADYAYNFAVKETAEDAANSLKLGMKPEDVAKEFKQGKANAMAEWAANTSGQAQTAKEAQVFKADTKMLESMAGGAPFKEAYAQWKKDTAAEKSGMDPYAPTPATLAKPTVAAKPTTASHEATKSLDEDHGAVTPIKLPSLDGKGLSGKDFNATSSAKTDFYKGMTGLKSTMEADSADAVKNKMGVEKILTERLKDSDNFQAVKAAYDAHSKAAGRTSSLERSLVSTWASTSGDSHPVAQAMQLSVRDAFNLQDTHTGGMVKSSLADEHAIFEKAAASLGFKADTPQRMATFKRGLQEFAQGQYGATQDYFASKGITELYMARGMKIGANEPKQVKMHLQPASSFSSNLATAKGFAGSSGSVYLAKVPVSQVLGSYLTGYGCSSEHEVVVLGGKDLSAVQMTTSYAQGGLAGTINAAKQAFKP